MAQHLVIGSNRGIGLELVRQLSERNERVLAACRTSTPELGEIQGVQVEQGIDITNSESLTVLAQKTPELDALWVVAGILKPATLAKLDFESIREQFEVNAIGPLRAVEALRPRLKKGSKIALLTSRMGSIADNSSGGSYGYRMSKAALNMAGTSLAHDLRNDGIAVMLLHPGWVKTDMTGSTGNLSATDSAAGLIHQFNSLELSSSGVFRHVNGEDLPW